MHKIGTKCLCCLLLCFGLSCTLVSCVSSSPIKTLSTVALAPEKDVLHLQISLKESLSPEQYHQLAVNKCESLGKRAFHPLHPDIEIYKLLVSFHVAHSNVAQISFQKGSGKKSSELEHVETLVYRIADSTLDMTKDLPAKK